MIVSIVLANILALRTPTKDLYVTDVKGKTIGAVLVVSLKHLVKLSQKYRLESEIYLVDKVEPRRDILHAEDTPNQISVAFMQTPRMSNRAQIFLQLIVIIDNVLDIVLDNLNFVWICYLFIYLNYFVMQYICFFFVTTFLLLY